MIVVESAAQPFIRRAAEWDVTGLPVPTDVLVYTAEEWSLLDRQGPFFQKAGQEAVWGYVRP